MACGAWGEMSFPLIGVSVWGSICPVMSQQQAAFNNNTGIVSFRRGNFKSDMFQCFSIILSDIYAL